MPNTKQAGTKPPRPTLSAKPKWDEEGFSYSPDGVEVDPNKLYDIKRPKTSQKGSSPKKTRRQKS